MERKKKKADLEQLLNSLIEKGWKPFGNYRDNIQRYEYDNRFFEFNHEGDNMVSIRELVSKESGLWQFVCENGMIKKTPTRWEYFNSDTGKIYGFYDDNSTYRLIESALKDESELEDFLLQNIKIDG